ncbi:MAG: hypothetical protein QW540_08100 [Archaeoglobaceae archaeon]
MTRATCRVCNKKFANTDSLIEHIRKEHCGKLSLESYVYLKMIGVATERILDFCEKNNIRIDVEIGFGG